MKSLIYVSSAVREFSQDELVALLDSCRDNNKKAGITGMLLYRGGNFMQLLEGDDEVVDGVYAKVEMDRRHHQCSVIVSYAMDERQFPQWSMGFHEVGQHELPAIDGYSEFMRYSWRDPVITGDASISKRLLLSFRQNMR